MRSTILAVFVAACSSGGGRTRPPHPGATDAAVPTPHGAPSDRECDELIAHAVAIRVAELKLAPEQAPTDAEQTQLRADLRASFLSPCRGGTREGYHCAMAARTLAELEACQATRTSSTSNSSVAPGGMTLPAPRLP